MEEAPLLIVNADDLGRTPGVTAGIVEAHLKGTVSSTTVMANLPGAQAAVERASTQVPGLGLGIHLNLTAGAPVLPPRKVPSLVGRDGRFHSISHLASRQQGPDPGHVRAEMTAQIERFRSWGREPTHLDCHHHALYLDPRFFSVLVRLASRYRLPIRYPWPRARKVQGCEETGHRPEHLSPGNLLALAEATRVRPEDLTAIIADCNAILQESSVRSPDRCVLSFYGSRATRSQLLDVIGRLPTGVSELMCHPGHADSELRSLSSYAEERERELAVLTDPQVLEAIRVAGVRLVSFAVLSTGSES